MIAAVPRMLATEMRYAHVVWKNDSADWPSISKCCAEKCRRAGLQPQRIAEVSSGSSEKPSWRRPNRGSGYIFTTGESPMLTPVAAARAAVWLQRGPALSR